MIDYMLNSALWSLVGGVIGFILGRVSREIHEIRQVIAPEDSEHPGNGGVVGTEGASAVTHAHVLLLEPQDVPQERTVRLMGVFLLLLGVFTAAQAAYFSIQDRQQTECFARNVEELVRASNLRHQTTAQDLRLIDRLVNDLVNSDRPDEIVLGEYLDARSETEEIRRQNPMPAFPTGECENG